MISLSSRDDKAEAQDYVVSNQMVNLEQSPEHSLKNLFELYFCRVGYFAVSHHMVSEAPILKGFKTQTQVELSLLQNKLHKCRLKRMKCELTKCCMFLYAFSYFFWLLK